MVLFITIIISSCTKEGNDDLASFRVFCEMVANDAKPIALHRPIEGKELDELWSDLLDIAEKYQVQLYREDNFPVSILYPAELTNNKSVVLIYKGNRLTQYEQYKADLEAYQGNDRIQLEGLARRFGRLLGYKPHGVNQLLIKNSDYRNIASFRVAQQITHLYYENINAAIEFYGNILGLDKVDSAMFKISTDAYLQLHPLNEEHVAGQPKSTAIAFLTDQLPEWYEYVQQKKIPIKYTYKPQEGGPHDGFVAIDPGGYLLEFEQFKQHPENELFIAALAEATKVVTSVNELNFYGSITWTYHKDMLMMQKFYEEVLGYQLVADQGWTKIYQTSTAGFIGLVDERRGMEDYAEAKAVEIEWEISDLELFNIYAEQFWQQYSYENNSFMGPEKYIYRVGRHK